MTTGFESYYAEGKIQYSSDFKAVSLIKSGYLNQTDFQNIIINSDGMSIHVAQINLPQGNYKAPILFIRTDDDVDRVCGFVGSSNYALVYKWNNLNIGNTNKIKYYIFAQAEKPKGDYGLQIYDGQGTNTANVMFDSSWLLLAINRVGVVPSNKPDLVFNSASGTYTVPNLVVDSTHAFCITRPKTIHFRQGSTVYRLMECAWIDGEVLKINWVPVEGSDTGGYGATNAVNNTSSTVLLCRTTHIPIPYSI